MTQSFTIPGRLPGYNELTRGSWQKGHGVKSKAMDTVGWIIKGRYLRPVVGKAQIEIRCFEPNKKRDPSNVRSGAEKIILDALQIQGIIKNDNWRWLHDTPAVVEIDRQNPRVEVKITEI